MKALEVKDVSKRFGDTQVLKDFNMSIDKNEFVCIIGKSGSGKSTLLNIIGALQSADSGTVIYHGISGIKPYSIKAEKLLRSEIGYLFQNFALVDDETVYQNLMIALEYNRHKNKKALISNVLKEVGLEGIENKKIYKCSGGEQQRIAIARLLLKPCRIILADEPTGSLDPYNKEIVMNLLLKLKQKGKTIVAVTHDMEVAKMADRVISLDNSHI